MTAPAEPREASRPGLVLAALTAGGSIVVVLQSLVVPALPVLQRELDTTPSGVTWVFTAYLLTASVATPIAGRLGDMAGKKRMLMASLTLLAAGTFMAALASTLPVLIVARLVQGLGGGFFPLAFGIIRDELPRDRVAAGIGLISGLMGIGSAAGILLAGPILEHLGYHWLFWLPLAVLVPTIVATFVLVPESPVRAPGSIDVRGALLLSLWLVLLLLAISEAARWGWGSGPTLGLFAASALALLAWIRLELSAPSPLVDMGMMRQRSVWTVNVAGGLTGVAMYASFVLITQFVETPATAGYGFGATVTEAGVYLLPSCVAMLVAAPLGGRLAGRAGSTVPLVLGCAVACLAFILLTVAHSAGWHFYTASFLMGAGFGLSFAALANAIVESVRPDQTGVATGMNAVMRTIGGALGAQVAASILAAGTLASGLPQESGYTLSFALMAVALAGAMAASLAVPRRRGRRMHMVALSEPRASVE